MTTADVAKKVMTRLAEQPFRTEIPKHVDAVAWGLCNPEINGNKDVKITLTEIHPGGAALNSTHPYEHVYFILSGRATAKVSGVEYKLEPGCCLYIAPNAEHEAVVDGGETLRFLVVNGPTI